LPAVSHHLTGCAGTRLPSGESDAPLARVCPGCSRISANGTPYVGGGLSWGSTNFGAGWEGTGLQGELSAGYEFLRASTLRTFVQVDAVLPFYNVSTVRYPFNYRPGVPIITDRRYAPAISVSLGIGIQRHRRQRP